MVSPLAHWKRVFTAYFRDGKEGLSAVASQLEVDAHEQPTEKFSKKHARYLPQTPLPPTLWRMSCGRCRFWEEGEVGEPGRCHIVGREDDPFGGDAIHYRGWCALWMPPEGEPAFAWVKERVRPDGKSSVRGEYDPELTEKERRRKDHRTVFTEPDARRKAIRGEEEEADGG